MSILRLNHHGHWSVAAFTVLTDLSDPSSLTECTSDNHHLGTSDTIPVAKHFTLKRQLD